MADHYEVGELTEEQFALYKNEWQQCLKQSSADPIFSSWAWCFSWWKTWSEKYELKLCILLVYSENDLIGIAPLYYYNAKRNFGPSGYQLQFIGNAWRIGPSVRSEHSNFIIRDGHVEKVIGKIRHFLKQKAVQDLVIQDHSPCLKTDLKKLGVKMTTRESDRGVSLDVTGKFQDWINSMGKNTRLKVYNRRNYLKDRIESIEVPYSDDKGKDDFFNLLCELHQGRRQEQPTVHELNFHANFAKLAIPDIKPIYSLLKVDGQTVSLIYDIMADDRRYNLQCVFVEGFDKKVSLGLLHLGYVVEDAFKDPSVKIYDFLAGDGKNTFYKERLMGDAGRIYELITSQISFSYRHALYISAHMVARKIFNTVKKTNE